MGSTYDLMIVAIGALVLIFVVMLVLTRAVIASEVIVGTVVLSLAASFGMAVLLRQYILGIQLSCIVMGLSLIILLAVGSDYTV